jgi:DNA-binding response OmpR family regulator
MATDQESRFEDLSLLVVDEDRGYAGILIQELRAIGLTRAMRAKSPKDALQAMHASPVDVVITEWYPQFVAFLRDADKHPNPRIPILVVTEHVQASEVIAARDAGVNEIMVKPVSTEILAAHIRDAVDGRRPFINAPGFNGPDRRRRTAEFKGPERRGQGAQAG